MLNKINNLLKSKRFWIYAIFTCLWLFEQFCCSRFGDDFTLFEQLKNASVKQKLISTLALGGWSSRFMIDTVALALLARFPFTLWMLLNTVAAVVLVYALDEIFNTKKENVVTILVATIFMIFPYFFESTAGWIATTVTYFWTIVAAVVSLGLFFKILKNDVNKNRKVDFILCILCGLFACDDELCNVSMVVISATMLLIAVFNKNKKKISVFYFVVIVLRFLLHVFWKTKSNRIIGETVRWFPDFLMLHLPDKLNIGFSTACHMIFIDYPALPFLLSITLAILVFIKHKDVIHRVIAIFPMFMIFLGILAVHTGFAQQQNLFGVVPYLDRFYNPQYGSVSNLNCWNIFAYIEPILWFFALSSILFSVFAVCENISESFIFGAILLGGLLSRVAMGFSPTTVASSLRTYVYMMFSILVCLIYFVLRLRVVNSRWGSVVSYSCGFIGIAYFINTVAYTFCLRGL